MCACVRVCVYVRVRECVCENKQHQVTQTAHTHTHIRTRICLSLSFFLSLFLSLSLLLSRTHTHTHILAQKARDLFGCSDGVVWYATLRNAKFRFFMWAKHVYFGCRHCAAVLFSQPPKDGEIALWSATNRRYVEKCVSQKRNQSNNKNRWYNILVTFIFKFNCGQYETKIWLLSNLSNCGFTTRQN